MAQSLTSGSVLSTAKVTVPENKTKEFLLTLSPLLELIKCERGCCDYHFYRDSGNDDTYVLIGEWESTGDWERHIHSENYTVLMGTLGVLGEGEKHGFDISTLIR